ncbi:hypothetical protein Fmac_032285 [Flemingia macrophylla]|uniref:Protein kinase domain-containing protein n=1 Tax=Flemingia macrophylla TaxID=520843 RepID=A0ABD1L4H3_9FABA
MEPLLREVLIFALALVMVVVAVALAADQIQTLPGCNSTFGNIQIPYPFGVGMQLIYTTSTTLFLGAQISSWFCNDSDYNNPWITTAAFSISRNENKFLTVGCDSYGLLNSNYENRTYSTGCLTKCYGNNVEIDNGTCSGIGCCQVDIPPRIRRIISLEAATFSNSTRDCSYSFLAKHNSYNFSTSHLQSFPYETLPLVLDWTVGERNCSSLESSRRIATAIVTLFVATTSLYLIYQKRKLSKLREKYFKQNGGSILLQQLSTRENSSQMTQIFTEEQLKKATNNFNESLIIGSGGFGTVFKGFLENNKIVAIKKSKIVDESQKEQFINEVIVLSQINHRNVVKLLGCCLEREVPLLVYEFVENGTVFDFLHTQKKVDSETWKIRLRIAAEAAGALSYLHSAASIPIIHRDVRNANILLDNSYTAKVSDFGVSRLVPLDQTEIATMVQGTFGYLDPEYMRTSQLTEKSDVYSFGVVLVELLTGEKAHSFCRPEEKRSLSNHFLSCLKEDHVFDVLQAGMVNKENEKEIIEVAILAARCLRLNGEERPSICNKANGDAPMDQ